MTPIATYTITSSDSELAGFILPDLFSHCRYPLRVNPHSHLVSCASEQWFFTEAHVVEPEITKFRAFRLRDYNAYCYPDADASHFRNISDFLNWAFMADDYFDDCDIDDIKGMRECCISALRDPISFQTENPLGKICKSFFSRITATAGSSCTERFIHGLDLFLIAAAKEIDNRAMGHTYDLESYTALRRNSTGIKCCFALIEYAAQMDLPNEVVSHPVIKAMEDAVSDYTAWCNDILSYNKEQSRHDTLCNLIAVLMREQGLDLQGAVDYSGQLCKSAIQRFEDNRTALPSWGEELDRQVAIYIQGMLDLAVGSLHWALILPAILGMMGRS
ncbi:isoprenoid synthase domain-containing protein [Suillus subaureus]|uniref:Terpene synthase n=1 Tax=Suillus subaureus TaxID=48587 RepID=A0A9P7JCN8_9AGAM|nr:isoprenoid synthase domain-containing protein [Suillus subaureus]KAG1814749.1 isoprenoid synthase domain-containing protein [Suillus subaureus]